VIPPRCYCPKCSGEIKASNSGIFSKCPHCREPFLVSDTRYTPDLLTIDKLSNIRKLKISSSFAVHKLLSIITLIISVGISALFWGLFWSLDNTWKTTSYNILNQGILAVSAICITMVLLPLSSAVATINGLVAFTRLIRAYFIRQIGIPTSAIMWVLASIIISPILAILFLKFSL